MEKRKQNNYWIDAQFCNKPMPELAINKSSIAELVNVLQESEEVQTRFAKNDILLTNYAVKIHSLAERFEWWDRGNLVGFLAVYINQGISIPAYITTVIIIPSYQGKGLGSYMLESVVKELTDRGYEQIISEIASSNTRSKKVFQKNGFTFQSMASGDSEYWMKDLSKR